MLFFKRALCGLACALWMVGAAHAVDAGLVDAVRSTMRSPGELHTYSGGPEVYGGTPLVVNDNGYYWIKGGQVYAVNGVAMGMSPKILKAPPSVSFSLIDKAIESGKEVPLPANLGLDMYTFPTALNKLLESAPKNKEGQRISQLKSSGPLSWEIKKQDRTDAMMTLYESGGNVTKIVVSLRLKQGDPLEDPNMALAIVIPAFASHLKGKGMDSPEGKKYKLFFQDILAMKKKSYIETINDVAYSVDIKDKKYLDMKIVPATK